MDIILIGGIAVASVVGIVILLAVFFRVVVSTNDVHIVQSAKKTVSYGKGMEAGNSFYKWPAWVPVIGVRVIVLPVSVFDLKLSGYEGYDKGRVPFVIDIMAFFRIADSNIAAQRVASFKELHDQLHGILQGATRSILAKAEIEEILEKRAEFGGMFTEAVDEQLKAWGVTSVKNIELMDIRDSSGSKAIENIMAKKKSLIERESRVAVAENIRAAQEAEIVAQREVKLREQEALQQVGQRTAEKDKQVGVANQQAQQEIKAQEKVTAEKHMAVVQVQEVRKAEIIREVQVVAADQEKQTNIIKAEGHKQQTVIVADGDLQATKLTAEGIQVEGAAKGAAETAILMAPVNSQIALAKEIGSNDGYQKYLLGIKEIDKNQVVGVAQAEALKAAEIKVIANAGDVVGGVSNVMELMTSKGGTQLGAAVEAFAQTPVGAALVKKLNGGDTAHN